MKRKQFLKGAEQIAQEGAIQIFKLPYTGMEEVIVGVVGTLQFDVFQYRLKATSTTWTSSWRPCPMNTCAGSSPTTATRRTSSKGNDVKLVETIKGNKLSCSLAPSGASIGSWTRTKDWFCLNSAGAKF